MEAGVMTYATHCTVPLLPFVNEPSEATAQRGTRRPEGPTTLLRLGHRISGRISEISRILGRISGISGILSIPTILGQISRQSGRVSGILAILSRFSRFLSQIAEILGGISQITGISGWISGILGLLYTGFHKESAHRGTHYQSGLTYGQPHHHLIQLTNISFLALLIASIGH